MEDIEATFSLATRRETRRLGARLAAALRPGDLVVLDGELGTGKTFLARAIARGLGVPVDVPVTSPTFALVHELPARVALLHADLHRLHDASELRELGLPPEGQCIALVEWGGRFRAALRPVLEVRLASSGDHGRSAVVVGHGARGRQLVAVLVG